MTGAGATIADMVELERGLRQLAELGVVQEALSLLTHQRQVMHAAHFQVCAPGCDGGGGWGPRGVQGVRPSAKKCMSRCAAMDVTVEEGGDSRGVQAALSLHTPAPDHACGVLPGARPFSGSRFQLNDWRRVA